MVREASYPSLDGTIWLNTAHQGVLPKEAAEAAREAVDWKLEPWRLTPDRFAAVPSRLCGQLATLLDVPREEVVLANSSSYGLHLLANGFPWRRGDEALVVRGDFPSTFLPFVGLERRGVSVRFVEPSGPVVTADEVAARLRPETRVFCTTWVHSFNGHVVDVEDIGDACRRRGVRFVLNASQGIGARPFRPRDLPVDAVTSVGFKWLCGPYGTGVCWIRRELLEELEYNQSYWLALLAAEDLEGDFEVDLSADLGARRFDLFGTANFFNFHAWSAALDLVLASGLTAIHRQGQSLVDRLLRGLEDTRLEIFSPREESRRSSLVFVSHPRPEANRAIRARLRSAGIEVALRRSRIRISPHFYNTPGEIDRVLEVLDGVE